MVGWLGDLVPWLQPWVTSHRRQVEWLEGKVGDPASRPEVGAGLMGKVRSGGRGREQREGGGSAAGHEGGKGTVGTKEVLDDGEEGIFSEDWSFEGIEQVLGEGGDVRAWALGLQGLNQGLRTAGSAGQEVGVSGEGLVGPGGGDAETGVK